MRALTFGPSHAPRLGVVTSKGVLDVAAAIDILRSEGTTPNGPEPDRLSPTPRAFYAAGLEALPPLRALVTHAEENASFTACFVNEADLELRPSVPYPSKIVCVGLNYLRHAREAGKEPPKTPVLFSKFANTLAGAEEPVTLPSHAEKYDYEAELVAVIGRRAKNVTEDQALSHVLGYCNGNDLSARELQALTGQWLLGKTLDGFLPLGPYLVTTDEVDDPQDLSIRCWLNGELRQDSRTSDMIFSVAKTVSYVSRYMTLEPGDVISTGTPEGVILGMQDQVWIKPGDEVVVEVGNLGRLTTPLVGEA